MRRKEERWESAILISPKVSLKGRQRICSFIANVHHTLGFVHGADVNFGILGNAGIEGETMISVNLEYYEERDGGEFWQFQRRLV